MSGILGPFRNILFFLLELFLGRSRRRMRRTAKTWKLVIFLLLVLSIAGNILLIRGSFEHLDEISDLKRRNRVVMKNNTELMELITQTRKVNDDFREINKTLKNQINMSVQTNGQLFELLKSKDLSIEKIEQIEDAIRRTLIAQAHVVIQSQEVIEEEARVNEKIDEETTINNN